MRTRSLILTAALAAPLLATSAHAGTRCTPLAVDPVGDTALAPNAGGSPDPSQAVPLSSLDIVSADVATDARGMTVVVRTAGDVTTTPGTLFRVTLSTSTGTYEIGAYYDAALPHTEFTRQEYSETDAVVTHYPSAATTTTFDGTALTVRIPASSFRALQGRVPAKGSRVFLREVATQLSFGMGFTVSSLDVDHAVATRVYRAGDKGCA